MSQTSTPPPSAPLESPSAPQEKFWTVGTLVYTASGIALLFFWLLWGDFALSLRDRSVGKLIELLLLKADTSNTLKQVLTATIPTTIGLVLGPAISYLSDRHRSPRGRRIPFLIYLTPLAGIAMVGIAFSPQIGIFLYKLTGHTLAAGLSDDEVFKVASNYIVGAFTVPWIMFEVAVLASGPVFGGLLNDVVPRPVLGRFHGMFRAVSLYDGILFNALLFQHAERHFSVMFALIGITFGGGFLLMCLKVKEGNYPQPEPEPDFFVNPPKKPHCVLGGAIVGFLVGIYACMIFITFTVTTFADFFATGQVLRYVQMLLIGTAFGSALGFAIGEAVERKGQGGFIWWLLAFMYRFFAIAFGYIKECFAQRYYLLYFIMACVSGLLFSPINGFSVRYAKQLQLENSDIGFIDAISYLVSLTLAFPLGMLVDRFHPLRMSLAALALYSITTLYGCFYAHSAMPFAIALVAHTIISGTYFTCVASLGQQLLPRSKFSQYASAGGIIGSLVNLLYQPFIGSLLDTTKTITIGADGKEVKLYNYHLVFWVTLVFLVTLITLMLMVYRKFLQYGGLQGYVAPGDGLATPTRMDPPKNMLRICAVYFLGAAVGLAVGYLLSYGVLLTLHQSKWYTFTDLRLSNIIPQMFTDKDIRNITTFCVATGVLPFLVLGGWLGSKFAKDGQSPAGAKAH